MKKASFYSALITTFLIPFYFLRFSIGPIKTNIFEIAILITLILFLIFNKFKFKKGFDYISAVFLVVSFVAVIFAADKLTALGIFKGWFVAPIIFGWLVYQIFDKEKIKYLLWSLYASIIIVSLWAIAQKFGLLQLSFYQQIGDFSDYISQGRVYGPFESPNFLAMYLTPIIVLSLFLSQNIQKYKAIFLVSLALPIVAVFLSGSRGGILALAIGLLVFLGCRYLFNRKNISNKIYASWSLVLAALIINFSYLFFFIKDISFFNSASDSIRRQIYSYSTDMIKTDWIWGIGLGGFHDKIANLSINNGAFQQFSLSFALHPHNLFMAFWLNLGLAGLIVLIWFLIRYFRLCYSLNNLYLKASLIGSMSAILVQGMFDTTYFKNDLSATFWLLLTLALIYEKDSKFNTK